MSWIQYSVLLKRGAHAEVAACVIEVGLAGLAFVDLTVDVQPLLAH